MISNLSSVLNLTTHWLIALTLCAAEALNSLGLRAGSPPLKSDGLRQYCRAVGEGWEFLPGNSYPGRAEPDKSHTALIDDPTHVVSSGLCNSIHYLMPGRADRVKAVPFLRFCSEIRFEEIIRMLGHLDAKRRIDNIYYFVGYPFLNWR
jgi:hypothetical protein